MTKPLDAASLVLIDQSGDRLLWAKRNPALKFLGGFHGFAGGKLERDDWECKVKNASDGESAALVACAVREAFEEVGVLMVRNGDKLTIGQRRSLHDDLISEREKFSSILNLWGLWIDARDLTYAGFWTTPEFSPIRFKTRFFFARMPEKQSAYQAITELEQIEFISPSDALSRWANGQVLAAPPVLFTLRAAADGAARSISIEESTRRLRSESEKKDGHVDHIELNSRFTALPLKTSTLPPANHTNCFVVGSKRFVVIDPASREESEQKKLKEHLSILIDGGGRCDAVIVSHLHGDHVGGEADIGDFLQEKTGDQIPIRAHQLTVDALRGKISFDSTLSDGDTIRLEDAEGTPFELEVLHTPGHAKGHLCFYDRELGFLLTMDNVISGSTVLIDPPEGNMADYLATLARLRDLPGLKSLAGSHGPAIKHGKEKIEEYISHRLEREREVKELLDSGMEKAEEIASVIYSDLDPALLPLATRSVTAHLEKIGDEAD